MFSRYLQQVADLIGADHREIVFTSGATESNNIAVKGVGRFYKSRKKHIITVQTVSIKLIQCQRGAGVKYSFSYLALENKCSQ